MVQLNFDANQVAPNTGYEPVPEGWYNVAISESEIKPTRDKEGAYLQLKAQVIDGPHTGKPIYIRLNIQNKNQQAVDIAYGELSAICHVTGVYQIGDSSQLHGIPFQLRVIVTKGQNGDPGNEVKGYKDARGNEPGKAGAGGGGQPGNFGGAPSGQGQGGGFGGQPQGQGNPNAGQGGQAWGQQNPQGQGQQQPPQGQGWGGQPQGNPQGQQPPQNGPQGGGWGQGQQPGQGQPDPNAGQQNPQGGAPWGGGQPAPGAQQQGPQGQQGNGGWQQQQNPQGQGGAPWGAQGNGQ